MKNILIALFLFLQIQAFAKIEENSITKDLTHLIEQTTAILQNSKDKKQEVDKIYDLIDPIFDFALMAKLSLGQSQYKQLNPSQQNSFVKEFEKKLKDSFVDKLQFYTDQKIKIQDAKKVKNRNIVSTWIIDKEKSYQIDYKFYDAKEKGWLVYDLEIVGIDVIQTYRSQFNGILKNKSFEELMQMLKASNITAKQ